MKLLILGLLRSLLLIEELILFTSVCVSLHLFYSQILMIASELRVAYIATLTSVLV